MSLRRLAHLLLAVSLFATPLALQAKTPPPPDHWVGTWAAATVGVPNRDHLFAQDTTLRLIAHTTLAGPLVRVVLSNEFGTEPLRIGAVHIAPSAGNDSISLFGSNALTFNGEPSITIPPGARVVSDPAGLTLKPFTDVAVSIFLPAQTVSTLSIHDLALQTSYLAPGNLVGQATLPSATKTDHWPILRGIEVRVPGTSAAVLTLGDSITDGHRSTPNTNSRWPDVLATRLTHTKPGPLAVLNLGISGNQVLAPGAGPAALARFDRDILAESGAKYLIVLEGINDIGNGYRTDKPASPHPPTAQDLITAFEQIITRAHSHQLTVIGGTITPYKGAGYFSPAGEQVREAVNTWIRSSGNFDSVIDFDALTRNPADPEALSPAADSGDHLHPSDNGYKLMGNGIPLTLFRPNKKAVSPQAKIAPPQPNN